MEIFYQAGTAEFETFDEATAYAEEKGLDVVQEMGGAYDEYRKCAFCGEWFPVHDLNESGYCELCAVAIRDHGGR